MRLKETVSVEYDNNSKKLIIKNGTKEYDIVDSDKKYYKQLRGGQELKVEKELEKFLKNKNIISPEFVGSKQMFENDRTKKILRRQRKIKR